MKKVKLKKLTLQNFKGVGDFTFTPDGQDACLYGDNGTGKTSCSDAYAWLLTDSDSQDNGKFQIKEFDAAGKVKQNIIHTVAGIFDFDGVELSLKKEYRETFSGKGLEKVFDGNKTLRFIDGLSVSRQAYQAKLEELAPKNVFKSLLNPAYFSAQKTEAKRSLILGLVDNVTQDDVIASNKELASLPGIIKSLSIEDYKSVAQKQKTILKKQRDEIPIRIDEIRLNQPAETGLDQAVIEKDIQEWEDKKTEAEKEKLQVENGGDAAVKTQELAKIRAQKIELLNIFTTEKNKSIFEKTIIRNEISLGIERLGAEIKNFLSGDNSHFLPEIDAKIIKAREAWHKIKGREYETEPETCPECGQKIPADQYKEAHKKGLEKFNAGKAKELKRITEVGKALAAKKASIQESIKEAHAKIQTKEKEVAGKETELAAIINEIENMASRELKTEAYKSILHDETECIKKIANAGTGETENQLQDLADQIEVFEKNIAGLTKTLLDIEKINNNNKRVTALSKEQKKLAKEHETLEKNIALVELYTKTWVEMVENPVNDLFEITTFQMFEEQINGGIKDSCVAMYHGVPYDDGLNKGHSKMIGLDIIKTFSKYYDVALPIFVDNAEGVTALPEMETQIIKLIKPLITEENEVYYSNLQTEIFNKS